MIATPLPSLHGYRDRSARRDRAGVRYSHQLPARSSSSEPQAERSSSAVGVTGKLLGRRSRYMRPRHGSVTVLGVNMGGILFSIGDVRCVCVTVKMCQSMQCCIQSDP